MQYSAKMKSINTTFDSFDKTVTRFEYRVNGCIQDIEDLNKQLNDKLTPVSRKLGMKPFLLIL